VSAPASPPGGASPSAPARRALAIAIAALTLAALALLGRELAGQLQGFVARVQGLGAWAPVAFVAGYAVATVLLVPGAVLTLAAGFLFGLARGTLLTMAGATLGACAAFLLARTVARRAVERRLEANPRFAAIDRAVAREGRKVVFLLRLSPAFPFNLLNYALGLTRVRFVDYLVACLGMLPGTFLYVYYGTALGSLAALASGEARSQGAERWVFLGVGLLATVAVTVVVTRLARRALREEVGA
jgi:uncharacterized membrane protein YdjX (TVP38/TMEM64 family)